MLISVEIKNIALIDHIKVDFSKGMNCLTGETGAGKSIIIDAIGCILGERTSRDLIRTGADFAFAEGTFSFDFSAGGKSSFGEFLENNGLPVPQGNFTVSREFDKGGKNSCKFNGKNISLSLLKSIGTYLIDIHGQNDNQSLLRTETHVSLLDLFAGKKIMDLLSGYNSLRLAYLAKYAEIRKLSGDPAERARKIDLLRYEANEIKAANLKPGEDVELEEIHRLLANSEKITGNLSDAYEKISGSAACSCEDSLGDAVSYLKKISDFSPELEDIFNRTQDIFYSLQDLSSDLRRVLDNVTFAPHELEKTDDRIDVINTLKRKYGKTIEDIIAFGKNAETSAEALEGSEEYISEAEKEINEYHVKMLALCEEIHDLRVSAAEKLEKAICFELSELEMPGAVFSVNTDFDTSEEPVFGPKGLDSVEFLMSANRGEPLKPLSRVASGGELSRIMLAIKKIFADFDSIPTMIFDEIDIGISGKTASSLGDKMKFISQSHQVICVTHLAQIAARSERNIIVSKSFNGESTNTDILIPDKDQRIAEIARLLDGDSTSDITIKHAEEMLLKYN